MQSNKCSERKRVWKLLSALYVHIYQLQHHGPFQIHIEHVWLVR